MIKPERTRASAVPTLLSIYSFVSRHVIVSPAQRISMTRLDIGLRSPSM